MKQFCMATLAIGACSAMAAYAAGTGNPTPGSPHDTLNFHLQKAASGVVGCSGGGHAAFVRYDENTGQVLPATIFISMVDWEQLDNDADGFLDEDQPDGVDNDLDGLVDGRGHDQVGRLVHDHLPHGRGVPAERHHLLARVRVPHHDLALEAAGHHELVRLAVVERVDAAHVAGERALARSKAAQQAKAEEALHSILSVRDVCVCVCR